MLLVAVVAWAATPGSGSPDISQDVWEHQMEQAGQQGSWAQLDTQIQKEDASAKDALADFEAAFPETKADRENTLNGWQPVTQIPRKATAAKKVPAAKKAKASSFAEVAASTVAQGDLLAPQQIALLERQSKDQVAQTWGDINAFEKQASLMREELHRPGTTIAGAIARVRARMGTSFIELDGNEEPETYMGFPMDKKAEEKRSYEISEGRSKKEKAQIKSAEDKLKSEVQKLKDHLSSMQTAVKKDDMSSFEDDDLQQMDKEHARDVREVEELEGDEREHLAKDLPEDKDESLLQASLLEQAPGLTKEEAEMQQKQRQITADMKKDLERIHAAEKRALALAVPSAQLLQMRSAATPGDDGEHNADTEAQEEEQKMEAKADAKEDACESGNKDECDKGDDAVVDEEAKKEEKEQENENENNDVEKEENENKDMQKADEKMEEESKAQDCENGENGDDEGADCEPAEDKEESSQVKKDREALDASQEEEKQQEKEDAEAEQDIEDGAEASNQAETDSDELERQKDEDDSDEAEASADMQADAEGEKVKEADDAAETAEAEEKMVALSNADEDGTTQNDDQTFQSTDDGTDASNAPNDADESDADDSTDADAEQALLQQVQQALVQRFDDDKEGSDIMQKHVEAGVQDLQASVASADAAKKSDEEKHKQREQEEAEDATAPVAHKREKRHREHRDADDDEDDGAARAKHDTDDELKERKMSKQSEDEEDGVGAAEKDEEKEEHPVPKKDQEEMDTLEHDIEAEANKEGKPLDPNFKNKFKEATADGNEPEWAKQAEANEEADRQAVEREAAEDQYADQEADEMNADELNDGSPDIDMDPMAKDDAAADAAARDSAADSLLETKYDEPLPKGQIYKPVAPQMRGVEDLKRAARGLKQFSQHVGDDLDDTPTQTQEATRSGADLLEDALSDLRREHH